MGANSAVLAEQRAVGITVEKCSGLIGAEIGNVDISQELSDADIATIRQALADHGVIFFRDQDLSADRQLAFGRRFSLSSEEDSARRGDPFTDPKITMIEKEEQQLKNIGGGWHADQTFNDTPPWGSILAAKELPSAGGDTLFASLSAAFDDLSYGLKAQLETMRAVHDNERIVTSMMKLPQYEGKQGRFAKATHPVVIRHPVSGRKILFVNRGYTTQFEGWTKEESGPLLEYLFRHCERPEYQVRLTWKPGSVAFWDNLQVLHYAANDYHGQRRIMQRISVVGAPLTAA
jgi:taurine dioxygenase